uniref:RUN domain-containing protein n=1 Tax=Strigamia maritima TaxID=126957 RepID=T1IJ55_STRMM
MQEKIKFKMKLLKDYKMILNVVLSLKTENWYEIFAYGSYGWLIKSRSGCYFLSSSRTAAMASCSGSPVVGGNVMRIVKQIMEEAVTRKFVHEESSSITSLCVIRELKIDPLSASVNWNGKLFSFYGRSYDSSPKITLLLCFEVNFMPGSLGFAVVETCLSHGLKRRTLGLFKTNSTTALLHKVAKNFEPAKLISQLVKQVESADPNKSGFVWASVQSRLHFLGRFRARTDNLMRHKSIDLSYILTWQSHFLD